MIEDNPDQKHPVVLNINEDQQTKDRCGANLGLRKFGILSALTICGNEIFTVAAPARQFYNPR